MRFYLFSVISLAFYSFAFPFEIMEDSVTKLNKFVENQFYENCFGIETFKQMELTKEVAESFCSNSRPEAQNIPPVPLSPQLQPLPILHPWHYIDTTEV